MCLMTGHELGPTYDPEMGRRVIFSRLFWREFWIDIRRARKDKRARKGAVLRLIGLIYFVSVLWFYGAEAYSFHDPATAIGLGVVFALIVLISLAVRWSQHREAQRLLADDIASADPLIVDRLQKLAYGLAAVNERASSELFTRYKTLPEGFAVNTRRIHIDVLRAKGVWDELPSRIRLWLMRPDGSWPPEIALQIRWTEEKLHTLLWALALTRELRPLERLEKPLDFAALEEIFAKPAPGIRPTWDLRVERNKAQPYFFRLYAESIHRGQQKALSEEQAEVVASWMTAIAEGNEMDSLSGAKTVAELGDETLNHVARSAACRYQVLSMLLDSLVSDHHWNRFIARLFNGLPRQENNAS